MPWKSTAISVGGSLLGGLFGGGSKKASRASRDAAAIQNLRLMAAQEQNRQDTRPYREAGVGAQNMLSDLLGTNAPAGYAARPNYDDIYAQVIAPSMARGGKHFRNSNPQLYINAATAKYREAMSNWEKGLVEYKAKNPTASTGSGSLLKPFTNEDFVRDPGYLARLLEGEQGEQRNLVFRGMSDSGQALKEIERYRQTYASNEFGNAYNRNADNKTRTYNFLSGQTSQGLNAAQGAGNLGANLASQAGQNSQNNSANMLYQQNLRDENRGNAFQSAIGNLVYGMNRNSGGTPPYVPSSGGYSSPRAGSFASQFVG